MASFNNITSYDEKLLDELEGYNQDDFNRNQIMKEFLSSDLYNNIKEGDLLIGFTKTRNIQPPINIFSRRFNREDLTSTESHILYPDRIEDGGLFAKYNIPEVGSPEDRMSVLNEILQEEQYNNGIKEIPSVFVVVKVQEDGPVNYFAELRQQNKIENIHHYSEPNTIEYFSLPLDPIQWRDKKIYLLEIPIYFDKVSKSYKFHTNSYKYITYRRSILDLFLKKYNRFDCFNENVEWENIKQDIALSGPFINTEPIIKGILKKIPDLLEKIDKFGNRKILSAIRNREIGLRGGFKKTKKNKKNKTKRKNNKGGTKRKKKTRSIVNKISDEKRRKKWVPMLNELVKKLREKEKIEKNERDDELLTPTGNSITNPDKSILTKEFNEHPDPPTGASFNPYTRIPSPSPSIDNNDEILLIPDLDDDEELIDVSTPNKKVSYIPPIINPDNINTPTRMPAPIGTPLSAVPTPDLIKDMRRDRLSVVSSDFSPTPPKKSNLTKERKKK
tara:strand:- start:483 stop:1988 length:1506 start_codon:yes stop_codon:yes gene_type:complete